MRVRSRYVKHFTHGTGNALSTLYYTSPSTLAARVLNEKFDYRVIALAGIHPVFVL